MAFNSNGQISYLVLDSLNHGSKYGLEIIEYITNKTNGGFIMKKPTLYSCLTRMEKKGLVSSSFWGESELGGKRHYYTITNAGKEELQTLAPAFENLSFDEIKNSTQEEAQNEPTFLQQSNLFDLVKPQPAPVKVEEDEDEDAPIENQINFFDLPQEQTEQKIEDDGVFLEEENSDEVAPAENSTKVQEKMEYYQSKLEATPEKDDGVFLDQNEKTPVISAEEQNKKIFDSASEFNKYRKRKSFSENQIEMSVVYENENDDEIQRERIAELKRSLLSMKNTQEHQTPAVEEANEETLQTYQPVENPQPTIEKHEEEKQDDGVFITARMSVNEVPVQRKIAPPNIDVFKDNLPAPKRNSDLEPTYKDMMSKIFERKMEKVSEQKAQTPEPTPQQTQQINDYDTLKRYYETQGIDFKEYHKAPVQKTYNTNLLRFINSIILFAISGISSALLFWIVSATNHLNNATNFMYYTIPILFFCYGVFEFARWKMTASKKAALSYSAIVNWIIFGLASVITLIVNVICGMNLETIGNYLTSLFLPIISFAIIFPINHYIIKFMFERYSK